MKINRILLHNVGPYLGSNEFIFDTTGKEKSMVLIGGKNGAGKTTLFNSIKIGLYGCKAYGFETINTDYLTEVNRLINSSERLNKNSSAKVLVEILIDDGKNDDIYAVERIWTFATKRTKETSNIYKNGKYLGTRESLDFENYLYQLIPPDLFKFYFFDGEKIGDFVFSAAGNSDFKNAFLKLCGLDTLELIKENFKRIYKNKNPNSSILDQYNTLIESLNGIEHFMETQTELRKKLLANIDKINDQIALLEKEYYQQGGMDKKKWESMQEQIRKEESVRDQNRRWLKDVANDVLPFIILRPQLENLKTCAIREESLRNHNIVKQVIHQNGPQAIRPILKSIGAEPLDTLTKAIVDSLSECIGQDKSDFSEILFLSSKEQLDLVSRIISNLAFDTSRIAVAVDEINCSLERTKKIRKKIEKTDMSNWQVYLEKTNSLLSSKSKLMEDCLKVEQELSENAIKKQTLEQEIKKIKTKYEAELKSRSLNDISAKAILAFDKLQTKLYKQFIAAVEKDFIDCFNRLINKQNLLDGIIVDEDLNVYPYKNRLFMRKEIVALLDKHGEEYIQDLVGTKAFEILKEKFELKEEQMLLPIEIKQTLSAGEKQVFIMSLYFALSQISPISVPYIIDTPFSRIDSHHRRNILEQFFMRLKGQIIILSTDEEIVDGYSDILANRIANQFVLEHQSNGSTRIIANRYFGDAV